MFNENFTESQTREKIIDRLLKDVGWDVDDRSQVIPEFEVKGAAAYNFSAAQKDKGRNESGFSDYLLLDRRGDPLAIIEAKKTSRDPIAGKKQAEDYADGIKSATGIEPLIFLTNGYEIWFWNRKRYPLYMVHGLFSREDLERIVFQNKFNECLHDIKINTSIIDRDYQIEALKRVFDNLERKRKKSLLVMATGTGKTRTAMALIDVLMRANWAQRVLFLADREVLADQAFSDGFKRHLPNESRCYIKSGAIKESSRLFVSTIQTMMENFHALSPAFFDAVIMDECHRSIYNKWKDVLSYFHSIQIGLTATPSDFVDRDTLKFFECDEGVPTFNYSYEKAIEDKNLVPFIPYAAQTNFQIKGIKGNELPPSVQKKMIENGMSIEEIDFEGTEFEKKVTNTGTNESLVREFMEVSAKDDSGVLPGKSIIFAISHNHAKRLWEIFNRFYPEYKGQLVEIIDSKMERPLKLLEKFKTENYPRIAISVDMLDTGVDIREVVNLVFAKPVFSKIKFWQMIGRGTRVLEKDPAKRKLWCTRKENFLIIDHWKNFEYFGEKPEGEAPAVQDAVPVKIFKVRLEKLKYFQKHQDKERFDKIKAEILDDINSLPENSITVRENRRNTDKALSGAVWGDLDSKSFEFLEQIIAPLMKFREDVNYYVAQFVLNTERLGLAALAGDKNGINRQKEAILEDIRKLPRNYSEVKAKEDVIRQVTNEGFWSALDHDRCEFIKEQLCELMRHKQAEEQTIIELDLDDLVTDRKWIEFGPNGEGDYVANYKEKVEKRILDIADTHPALVKIKKDEQILEKDLADLSDTLNSQDLYINEDNLRKAFFQPAGTLIQFLKSILGKYKFPDPEETINEAFSTYIVERNNNNPENPLSAEQVRFLRTIKNVFAKKKHIEYGDLFEPPFQQFGAEAATRLFSEDELHEILGVFNTVKV